MIPSSGNTKPPQQVGTTGFSHGIFNMYSTNFCPPLIYVFHCVSLFLLLYKLYVSFPFQQELPASYVSSGVLAWNEETVCLLFGCVMQLWFCKGCERLSECPSACALGTVWIPLYIAICSSMQCPLPNAAFKHLEHHVVKSGRDELVPHALWGHRTSDQTL